MWRNASSIAPERSETLVGCEIQLIFTGRRRGSQSGNCASQSIFWVGRGTMLVNIQAFEFAGLRDTQDAEALQDNHHNQRYTERSHTGRGRTKQLVQQLCHAAAVEEAGDNRGRARSGRTRRAVRARGKQAKREVVTDAQRRVGRGRDCVDLWPSEDR